MRRVIKQDLVARVVAAGCERPSDDLLRRLAREGLLQRPRQRHPGRRRGSVTEYPAHAVDQAIGVLRLHSEVHRFENLRFWSFWDGFWVESRTLRQTLSRWMKSAIALTPRSDDLFELAEQMAFSTSKRGAAKGPEDGEPSAQSAVFAISYGAMGGDPGWNYQPLQETTHHMEETETPTELAEGLLQLPQLTEPIGSFGQILDQPPHPKDALSLIAGTGLGNPGWWNDAIRTVPLTELAAARDTARTLVENFVLIADTIEQAGLGEFPAAATSHLRAPRGRGAAAIRHRVQMIGSALAFNRLPDQVTLTEILETISQTALGMRDALAAATADT